MQPRVRSTNLARPKPEPGGKGYRTGIDKRPVPSIEVFRPGPRYGDGPGVVGDHVGDSQHHGGEHKAVYAFSREELDRWGEELTRGFSDGFFGENLTTEGIDLESLRIGQRLRIGPEVVLEVSIPRSPCATFAGHVGEKGWVRRFTEHGRCGVYLRVLVPGTVTAGDEIELLDPPEHEVTMLVAFAAVMGDDAAAEQVVAAGCLPAMHHERLVDRLARRPRRAGQ